MSEQKSLPRRGRSRYHHQQYQFSTNTTPRHHNNNKNNQCIQTTTTTTTIITSTTTTTTNNSTGTGNSITSSLLAGRCISNTNTANATVNVGHGGNLKTISNKFKSQDSIQCHIQTLAKSPTITTTSTTTTHHQQQQLQYQLQQQQQQQLQKKQDSQTHDNVVNNNAISFTNNHHMLQQQQKLTQQQPLLITPKLTHLIGRSSNNQLISNPSDILNSSATNNQIASSVVAPVTCMTTSQFRPISHKNTHVSLNDAHNLTHHHHPHAHTHATSTTTILNPSTAPLSSKFFSATTLPK